VHWKILFIGKPKLDYAKIGVADYRRRLERFVRLEMEALKEGTQTEEGDRFIKRSAGSFRIALDPVGKEMDTDDWVDQVNRWELQSVSSISFLIGGANGHDENLRRRCDAVWSLSQLTMQHELALLVLLEQLYRVYSIKRGEPESCRRV